MRKLAEELMVSERCATIEMIVTLRGVVFQHAGGELNIIIITIKIKIIIAIIIITR